MIDTITTPHYAGFWRRLLAFILDSLLYSALVLPLLFLLYGHDYFAWLRSDTSNFASYGIGDLFLSHILPFILLIVFWVRWGATPGKLLLDCRVVDAKTLQPLSLKQATIRALGYIISALPFYLGFVWIAFDKRKQGLHDKLAGSVVLQIIDDDSKVTLSEWLERFPV